MGERVNLSFLKVIMWYLIRNTGTLLFRIRLVTKLMIKALMNLVLINLDKIPSSLNFVRCSDGLCYAYTTKTSIYYFILYQSEKYRTYWLVVYYYGTSIISHLILWSKTEKKFVQIHLQYFTFMITINGLDWIVLQTTNLK